MSISSLFLIFILALVLGWCIYWHFRENKSVIEYWSESKKLTLKDKAQLTRFAWSRSIQLFGALVALLLIVMIYGIQMNNLTAELTQLKPPATYYPPAIPQPAEVKASKLEENPKIVAEPQAETTQLQRRTTNMPPEQEGPKSKVEEVFNPSATDQASYIDALKQQYEDTIILYFIMDRCKHADSSDYSLIMDALRRDMDYAGAPDDLKQHVVTAAQGSYRELYTKNPCNTPTMTQLAKQYREYIHSLSETRYN